MMRKQLHEIMKTFSYLMDDITDIKNVLEILAQNGYETGLESKMQSILNTQLKLLEKVENECIALDEKFEEFMNNYLHEVL